MVAILALVLALCVAPLTYADDEGKPGVPGDMITPVTTGGGVATGGVSEQQVGNLGQGKDLRGNAFGVPMVFSVRIACQAADPGDPDPSACQKAALGCLTNGVQVGIGLLYEIYARPAGSSGAWQY
ncbi:MAG: hypothetical protein WBC31_01240, partial [Candidatus Phosphoribacter baldrii]